MFYPTGGGPVMASTKGVRGDDIREWQSRRAEGIHMGACAGPLNLFGELVFQHHRPAVPFPMAVNFLPCSRLAADHALRRK